MNLQPVARALPYIYIAALITAGWYLWDSFTPAPAPVGEYVPATVAPALRMVPQEIIQPKQVKVYAQPAKAKLKLPPAMQQDPSIHVLAATKVKPDLHPQTIVTTLNAETGEPETLVRRDPLPWLRAEQTGELRIDYGYKNSVGRVGRITVREDLLQVKALHAGINASLDSDGQMFAGVGVGWRW